MSSVGVDDNSIVRGAADWRTLSDLMQDASSLVAQQSTYGIPASAQPAAESFLSNWSSYATQSADLATGFAGALDATKDNYHTADDATDQTFANLDGRLGPQR